MTSPITHEKIIEVLREALVDLCDAWEHNGGKFDGNITKSTATGRIALETASDLYQRLQAEKEGGWQPIETAPKDGTRFWGLVGDDALAMFWHPQFAQFITGCRRLTLAPGYTYEDGSKSRDYAPEIRSPTHWMPLPPPPLNQEGGDADEPRRIEPHVATPAPGENSGRAEADRELEHIASALVTSWWIESADRPSLLKDILNELRGVFAAGRRSGLEEAAKVVDECPHPATQDWSSDQVCAALDEAAAAIRAIPEKQS